MASEQSRLDAAAASILAAYTAKQIASGGYEVWPPELAAQMRVDDMRAALLASLPVLLGEPVAWHVRYIDPVEGPSMWSSIEERHVELMRSKQYFEVRPLYAPSLGEGDGR